jgi:hypothetical protein
MPFSAGTFSLYTPGNPVVTGTTISSTWANNTLQDIGTGLSTCVLKDGTQTITANIPMSGFKFTGLGAGTASGNSIRYEQVLGVVTTAGDLIYASAAGTLARLAIGTAGQRLVVNSGATAPAWGNVFTSAAQTITAAGSLTLAHGLGATPNLVEAILTCTDAGGEAGYAQNDQVFVSIDSQDVANNRGLSVVPDATNLNIRFGSGANTFNVVNKSGGGGNSITNSKWTITFRAWVLL